MKRKSLAAVIAAILLIGTVTGVSAVTANRTIEISEGVSVYMDGKEIQMTDQQGNPVSAFIYDGTTYLPARAISEANGNDVAWDGDAYRVDITSHTSDASDPNAARVCAEEDKYLIFEVHPYLSCGRPA